MWKGLRFDLTADCQVAFNCLKSAFTSAPVLVHYNPENPTVVETDGSEYAIAAILSQIDQMTNLLHPIAFHSRSMSPTELNYNIYNKELLAIYEAFHQWRPYLEGAQHSVLVVTDHNNLQYFTTSKQLSQQQARWSEFLSSFDFVIKYHPGHLGTKPDTLTHCSDVYPKGEDRAYTQTNPQNFQPLFNPRQVLVAVTMDLVATHHRIRSALAHDPYAQEHLR